MAKKKKRKINKVVIGILIFIAVITFLTVTIFVSNFDEHIKQAFPCYEGVCYLKCDLFAEHPSGGKTENGYLMGCKGENAFTMEKIKEMYPRCHLNKYECWFRTEEDRYE